MRGEDGAGRGEVGMARGEAGTRGEGGSRGDGGAPSTSTGDLGLPLMGDGDGGAECSSPTGVDGVAWREKEIGGASEPDDVGLDDDGSATLRRLVGRTKGLLGRSPVASCEGLRTKGFVFSGDREGDKGLVGDSEGLRTVEGERRRPGDSGRRNGEARGEWNDSVPGLVGDDWTRSV